MSALPEVTMLQATVVVPCYNNAALIGRCLESLQRQTLRDQLEIIVVDDGSKDASTQIVAGFPVKLIRQKNGGPAAARNTGAAAAQAPIVLFLDGDCVAPPRWAESMIASLQDGNADAAVGTLVPSTEGVLPALIQMEIEQRYSRLRRRDYVDFIAAPSCAARHDCFINIGGFNEAFRFNEDVEFAFRLNAAGYRIRFVQDVPVAHAHQTRWWDYVRAKFWRGVWRMRLYRLYPKKSVRDDWTPQSLKLQILSACLTVPAALVALFAPMFWAAFGLLLAMTVALGWPVIDLAIAGMRPRSRLTSGFFATLFLLVRSFTLAASLIYDRATTAHTPALMRPIARQRRPLEDLQESAGRRGA
jgi:GT2 family glycosyltransferase